MHRHHVHARRRRHANVQTLVVGAELADGQGGVVRVARSVGIVRRDQADVPPTFSIEVVAVVAGRVGLPDSLALPVIGVVDSACLDGGLADLHKITVLREPAALERRNGIVPRDLEYQRPPVTLGGRGLGEREVDVGREPLVQVRRTTSKADARWLRVIAEIEDATSDVDQRSPRDVSTEMRRACPRLWALVRRIDVGLPELDVGRIPRQHQVGAVRVHLSAMTTPIYREGIVGLGPFSGDWTELEPVVPDRRGRQNAGGGITGLQAKVLHRKRQILHQLPRAVAQRHELGDLIGRQGQHVAGA